MKKSHINLIIILTVILCAVWILPYFELYSFKDALIITISAIVGGGIAEFIFKKK